MIENVQMLEVPEEILEPEPIIIKGKVEIETDFEANLTELIKKYPKEWAKVKKKCAESGYYREWEAGAVFLHEIIEDATDFSLNGPYPHLKDIWGDIKEIDFKWTKELAQQLELRPKANAATVDEAAN